jgi:hypothetical protein
MFDPKKPFLTISRSSEAPVWARHSARFLLDELQNNQRRHLLPAFIASLSFGIEAVINDALIDFFYSKFGEAYSQQASSFLRKPISEKLTLTPLLLSGFRYEFNEEHRSFKTIIKLFRVRNNMLHAAHHWKKVKVVQDPKHGLLVLDDGDQSEYYARGDIKDLSSLNLEEMLSAAELLMDDLSSLQKLINRRNFLRLKNSRWFRRVKKPKAELKNA